VGTTHEGHSVVFITVQNLVGIDAVVLIICTFFDFASSAWKRLFTPQNCFFRGKMWERVGRYWPPTNSFLLLGVYTSVSNLVKIDEEMRPWECPQTDTHTHTRTHGQTQNDFIICPMLYAIAMGQIIIPTHMMNREIMPGRKEGSTASSINCDRCRHHNLAVSSLPAAPAWVEVNRLGWPLAGVIHSTSQG